MYGEYPWIKELNDYELEWCILGVIGKTSMEIEENFQREYQDHVWSSIYNDHF